MVTQTGQVTATRRDEARIVRGTTGIDDSVQTETTAWRVLTITASGGALKEVAVEFDMNKATDGYGVVETTASIQFAVGRLVDGTNWRIGPYVPTTALTGSLAAAGRAIEVPVGDILAGASVRIYALMSADATADMNLPFQVLYKGTGTPLLLPIVNG